VDANPAPTATGVVLIVDDEETVLRSARTVLEGTGNIVHTASGGKEAVACIQSAPKRFDLVLLDLNMTDLSGEETLRIRDIDPSVPGRGVQRIH
jgi:two-component system cell cycle sensor histidine kinase/response regulator CckA